VVGGGKFKLPTLTGLHQFLFKHAFSGHNTTADVETSALFFRTNSKRSFLPKN
jgi:DNA polymerase-3 subunit alpha